MELRIKEILKEKNIPIGELAKRIDLSFQNTSRLINGHSKPSITTYEKIAEVLKVEFWELFTDSFNMEKQSTRNELTALIDYKNTLYKANTLEELENIIQKIKEKER